MRSTYISNGTLEKARRAARRRWWLMALWNTTCMLLFTGCMLMLAYVFFNRLG